MMKILFGGSFDPIHLGHIYIIRKVIELYKPEKFIIVPAYQSVGKKSYLFDCEFRLKLILKALSELPVEIKKCIEISDYELKQRKPVYTYETILNIKPNTLLVGADVKYTQWKFFNEIIDNYIDMFIVFPRYKQINNPRYNKEIIFDSRLIDNSSTEIKKKLYLHERINNYVPHLITTDIERYFHEYYFIKRTQSDYCKDYNFIY
ncbi:MAG: nicotinate-nicotinamide nucleotide adenylyltransferase [Candidatus Anstonellales archaeon]